MLRPGQSYVVTTYIRLVSLATFTPSDIYQTKEEQNLIHLNCKYIRKAKSLNRTKGVVLYVDI